MADKHYFNDYKKIMGVDQGRTASQKLLDRALGKRQTPQSSTVLKMEQPQKKIKKQSGQDNEINKQEAINKIIKILGSRNNINKTQKGLQVLRKCYDEEQFLESFNQNKIKQIVSSLLDITLFSTGTLNQYIKLSQIQRVVLIKTDSHISKKYENQMALQSEKIKLECLLLNLVTDDSFNFSKDINNLKSQIFQAFSDQKIKEKNLNEDQQDDLENKNKNKNNTKINNKEMRLYIQQKILNKLLTLPNLYLEWVKTGIINLLKQFIVQHKQKLTKPKQFLSQYNKLLQGKKSNQQSGSYDIMGSKKGNAGGTYSTVIQQQDAASAWCKRQ